MPMFDDPKEQLQRIQAELLAAEEEEYDDLSDIDDLLEEYLDDDTLSRYSEDAEEDLPAFRNYSNNARRAHTARFVDTDEYPDDLDDDAVFYREDYRAGKRKQSNRGLIILICLELIAIACVLGWWASWLL